VSRKLKIKKKQKDYPELKLPEAGIVGEITNKIITSNF
jgi:hypothetical protein